MTTPEAPDPRKVAEAALDVFVYVPVGLALEARELLPKLAERGRNQVVLARLGARFAVQKAEAEAEKLLARLAAPIAADAPAAPASDTPPTAEPGARRQSTAEADARAARDSSVTAPAKATRTPRHDGGEGAPNALAIPGYDTLSASQVVPRLDALRPGELEAIRRHEHAHRGRRTILSRIAQLPD